MSRISAAQGTLPVQWLYEPITNVQAVAYSPDGTLIAVGGQGGVQVFSVSTGILVRCLPTAANASGRNSDPGNGIAALAFSPDGKTLAVGGQHFINLPMELIVTGVAELWDVATGTLIASLGTSADNGVYSVAFSKNGATLALGGQHSSNPDESAGTGVLELWNVSTATLKSSLATSAASVNAVAFSSDGITLGDGGGASGDFGGNPAGVLELWNATTGALLGSLNTAATKGVASVAFSPDGTTLADGGVSVNSNTSATFGVLELWNVANGKLDAALETTANSGVAAVSYSPDGKTLADGGSIGGSAGVLELWNVTTDTQIGTFATTNPQVNSVAFSPDGTALADGGGNPNTNGVPELFDLATGVLLKTLNTIANTGVTSVAFSPDGTTMAYGGSTTFMQKGAPVFEGMFQVWNVATGTLMYTIVDPAINGFGCAVNTVAFSPDSKTLAVGGASGGDGGGVLQLWEVATGTLTTTLNTAAANRGLVNSVAFSPDGTKLADAGYTFDTTSFTGIVELWNPTTGSLISSLNTSTFHAASVAFSPDGKLLADGGVAIVNGNYAGAIEIWSLTSGGLLNSLKTAASEGVNSVAFSPDSTVLVDGGTTSTNTGVLELWKVSNGLRIAAPSLLTGTTNVYSVAYSADGNVVFAGANLNFQAYSTTTFELLDYFDDVNQLSSGDPLNSIAISSSGAMLAYGTGNGLVVVADNPFYNTIAVSSISVNPQTVLGGTGSTGTVILAKPAPAAGDSVALFSGNTSVGVPGSVRVQPGDTQATFPITTETLSSNASVTITATSAGASTSATLNVSNLSVGSLSFSSSMVQGGSSSTATITLSGPAPAGGVAVGLTSNAANGTVPPIVTVAAGSTTATFTVETTPVDSQVTVTITAGYGAASKSAKLIVNPASLQSISLNPTTVAGGSSSTATVMLDGPAGPSGVMISIGAGNPVSAPNSVTVPSGQSSTSFKVNTVGVSSKTVTQIVAQQNSLTQQAALTISPTTIALVSVSPSIVVGGSSTTGTVTLNGPAPSDGLKVELSSNNSAVTVPASILIAGGNSEGTFTVKSVAVSAQKTVILTAHYQSTSKMASLTISPASLVSVNLNPTVVAGGASSTGTVTLSSVAGTGGLVVKLSSGSKSATVPGSVTVAAGKTSATFTVKSVPVSAQTVATVTGTANGVSQTANLTITAPALVSVTLNPSTVVAGKSSTGTVTISSAAPSGGIKILVSSSLSTVSVPASVTIPAGKTSATFTVKTTSASAQKSSTITATLGAVSKTATLNAS